MNINFKDGDKSINVRINLSLHVSNSFKPSILSIKPIAMMDINLDHFDDDPTLGE